MKLLLCLVLFAGSVFAQCGQAPHCVVVSWSLGPCGTVVCDTTASYNISRGTTAGGPYTPVGTTPAAITSFTDSSGTGNVLVQGTTYFYVVDSVGTSGGTSRGNEASAKIPFLPPPPPTGTSATAH